MDERERERRDKALRRPRGRVAVSFDVAGRKTVQYIDEEEDEEEEEEEAARTAGGASGLRDISVCLSDRPLSLSHDCTLLHCADTDPAPREEEGSLQNSALLATAASSSSSPSSCAGGKAAALYLLLRDRCAPGQWQAVSIQMRACCLLTSLLCFVVLQ
jgi:hypothetical protein